MNSLSSSTPSRRSCRASLLYIRLPSLAAAGVELKYATDAKAQNGETAVNVFTSVRQKKYDFEYSGPAVTFSR